MGPETSCTWNVNCVTIPAEEKKHTHTNTKKSVTEDFDEQNFGFAFWSLFEEDLEMEVSKFKHLGETDRL
jgi:DNA replication protein DnaD